MYDVIVIGAGVSGAAVARELSRYVGNICVLDKEEDVCCGTSKANSAIIHAGFDAPEGSLKALLNVRGNEKIENLSKELDFPYIKNGSLVLCLEGQNLSDLYKLYHRGTKNGVKGLRILKPEEVFELEPNISRKVQGALYATTGGIVCPFDLNLSMAENAAINGVKFYFNKKVVYIEKNIKGYKIETEKGFFETRCIVNAAGVYADELHNMVSKKRIEIVPRKGEYCLLDKNAGNFVKRTIFSLPGSMGKGILVTPTVHGNLLLGPTAENIEDKEATRTTKGGMDEIWETVAKMVPDIPKDRMITSFAGLRAHETSGEFIIGEAEDSEGFFDCAGIESPGLSCCIAIGEMVADQVSAKLKLQRKKTFINKRKGIIKATSLSELNRNALIKERPAFGNIICRCEEISEGEILEAIHRPLGAVSVDGIKRRTRAGMGRCQSGFCITKVLEILAREQKKEMTEITKSGGDSWIMKER